VDLPNASRSGVAAALDGAFGGTAGADWMRIMDRAGRIWDATRRTFLESPLDGWRTLARQSTRLSDLRTIAPWRSLRGLGRQYLHDPHLRMLLDRYATYTGSDPRRAPAALATVPYVEQTFGAWYVRGGLRRLGIALHQRAIDRGVQVQTSCPVDAVELTAGRVRGVRLADGREVPADIVVSDVDARHLYADLLAPQSGSAPLRRIAAATPSLSGFVLMLALRGRTPDLAHHTVLFPRDYDAEFDAVFGIGRNAHRPHPPAEPTVYVAAPDDPALRPDDEHEAWFVLVNAPRQARDDPRAGVDWTAPGLASSYAEQILDLMASRGLDVRDRLLWKEIRTPADLEQNTRSPGGAIYGTSSNGVRAAFLRPANRSPVPGLFLVGGSAHPGGGLPLVGLSAAIVAELVGRA
jgi:phytoene desaturase